MKRAIKKLTEYCDKGKRQQNFVSFTIGLIVSMILMTIQAIMMYIN